MCPSPVTAARVSTSTSVCSHPHPLCLHPHHPFLPWVQPHCSVVKVTAHPTLTSPSFRGASPLGSGGRPSPGSRCLALCARADPRLHHLAGCAGVTPGYGLPQHHAVRVAPCPGHVPPLHGLLPDAQSEYTRSARRAAADVSAAFPSSCDLAEKENSVPVRAHLKSAVSTREFRTSAMFLRRSPTIEPFLFWNASYENGSAGPFPAGTERTVTFIICIYMVERLSGDISDSDFRLFRAARIGFVLKQLVTMGL